MKVLLKAVFKDTDTGEVREFSIEDYPLYEKYPDDDSLVCEEVEDWLRNDD